MYAEVQLALKSPKKFSEKLAVRLYTDSRPFPVARVTPVPDIAKAS